MSELYPGQAYFHAHNPNIKRAEERFMRYVANPVEVDAFEINSVQFVKGNENAFLTLEDGRSVTATPAMMSRMAPRPGDYWVVQSDGYEYLNPKAVFERKYSPKSPEAK